MIWFQRLFPAVMLLWPVVFTIGVRPRGGGIRGPRSRRLLAMTGAFLGVHVAVMFLLEGVSPVSSPLRVGWCVGAAVMGGLLLWFGWGMPALAERLPALTGGHPTGERRAASLVPREHLDPVPRAAWVAGWVVFALCVACIGWAVYQGAPWALGFGLCFWLGAGPLAARRSLTEAEPLDPEGHAGLEEAYASLRRLKAWGFYCLGLSGTIVFAGVAAAFAFDPRLAGVVGAIAGTAIGVSGGVFGAMAGMRRARIHEQLREPSAR